VTRISGAALFAVVAWGASFVATRFALEAFTPFALVALRLTLGVVLLLAVARWQGHRAVPGRGVAGVTVLLGLIVAAHLLIQAIGLGHTTAMNTAWIISFIPVVIAIGARLFLGQRLPALAWAGVAIASLGVLLVTAQEPPDFAHARLGDLLQLGSCFTWAAYTLLAVRPLQRWGSLAMTAGPMAVAAAVLSILEGEDLVTRSAAAGEYLVAGLTAAGLDVVGGRGLLVGLELGRDSRIFASECRGRGLLVYPATESAILLGPPRIIDEAEMDEIVTRLAAATGGTQH